MGNLFKLKKKNDILRANIVVMSYISAGWLQPTHVSPECPRSEQGAEKEIAAGKAGRGFLREGGFADLFPVGLERRDRWQRLP